MCPLQDSTNLTPEAIQMWKLTLISKEDQNSISTIPRVTVNTLPLIPHHNSDLKVKEGHAERQDNEW